ncbi:Na+/H+ antiporter subunit E [Halonatronum saccharophilum]|uniref:Na+/H+ antiporter subunit E n=1 Tax=Halonatronum saccharophilum TaxID=150060 RepID=UPI0004B6C101|nr:Na+/H+ antiporter subunit E [Halonatronum saccharophilum]
MKKIKDLLEMSPVGHPEDLFTILLLFTTWIISSGDFSPSSLVLGLFISFLAVFIMHSYFTRELSKKITVHFLAFFWYLIVLAKEALIASYIVAYLTVHPKLPFKSSILKVPTNLEDENKLVTMTILANTITLTPGTLTVDLDVENKFFYIHCLDHIEDSDRDHLREELFGDLERAIRRVFR